MGLVDEEQLLQIRGRSKNQIQLADVFPNQRLSMLCWWRCLLTDPEFAHRMRDLINTCDANVNDVNLLKRQEGISGSTNKQRLLSAEMRRITQGLIRFQKKEIVF